MKRVVIVLAFTVAASALALAQGGSVEQSIKALTEQWRQASLRGDVATIDKLAADDYIVIGHNGATLTKADVLENFKSGKLKVEAIEISDMKVRVYGDTALFNVIGRFVSPLDRPLAAPGKNCGANQGPNPFPY